LSTKIVRDGGYQPTRDPGPVPPELIRKATCKNCGREPWMGRPLHDIGGGRKVCTDCFCFFSRIDPRDPAAERTARSGDPVHLRLDEWHAAGEPSVPVPLSDTTAGLHVEEHGWPPRWLEWLCGWLKRVVD
jgi:hypothetical protein